MRVGSRGSREIKCAVELRRGREVALWEDDLRVSEL